MQFARLADMIGPAGRGRRMSGRGAANRRRDDCPNRHFPDQARQPSPHPARVK
jgi:hypothetical protein